MSNWNNEVLNLADLYVLRRTVRVEAPDEAHVALAGPIRYPEIVDIDRDLVTNVDTNISADPSDPGLITITHLVSVIPPRLKEHIEEKAEAAHLAAFEQAAEQAEGEL